MLKAEIPDLLTRIIHGWVHAKAGTVHYIMSRFWKAKLFYRPFTFKRTFTFMRPLKQTDFTEKGFGLKMLMNKPS